MASAVRWFWLVVASTLLVTGCGVGGTADPAAEAEAGQPPAADETAPIEPPPDEPAPDGAAESGDEPPIEEPPPEEADPPVTDDGALCGIWQLVDRYEDPNEMGEAIFGGEIDGEAIAPARIAECLGFNSWRQQLVFDGLDGDGLPTKITVDTDISIDGNTVSSHERYLLDGELYEARSVGDSTWLRGPTDDWFEIPDGDPVEAILELAAEHADTFGAYFSAGTLTGLGLVGSMVYAPLASPGDPVEVDGVRAVKWSVSPEAASGFAADQGADLSPEFFASARAEYWVTANGQVIKIDLALPAGVRTGGAPDGSVLMRLYDFGEPITIVPLSS